MERQRNVLVDCLCRKGITMCKLYMLNKESADESKVKLKLLEEITVLWRNMLKFVDPNDNKVSDR